MLRLLTYNVHRCLGTDGLLSPERIAHVIASCKPDVVALQELDVGRERTGGVDQAHAIAEALGMKFHFHPALRVMEEQYGDAILTALPSRLVKAAALPGLKRLPNLESRGALWASVVHEEGEVQIVNSHLGLNSFERLRQAKSLLGPEWLGGDLCRSPLVLLGDFNAIPRSRVYRRFAALYRDAQRSLRHERARPTFPSYLPVLRIDHVFVDARVKVVRTEVVRNDLTRTASDHLPLVVDIEVGDGRGDARDD